MPELRTVPMFQWTREYEVGVDQIDREHQHLFVLAERMHEAMLAMEGKQFLHSLLDSLTNYTRYHFSHEEALMERSGYYDLVMHRQQHQALRAQVQAMQRRAATGETTMTIEVAKFLIDWLKLHTTTSDRKIAEHLKRGYSGGGLAATGVQECDNVGHLFRGERGPLHIVLFEAGQHLRAMRPQ